MRTTWGRLVSTLALCVLAARIAGADESPCNEDGFCLNDPAVAKVGHHLQHGTIKSFPSESEIEFTTATDDLTLSYKNLAITKAGECMDASTAICVGLAAQMTQPPPAPPIDVTIQGFFPATKFVVVEVGGSLQSVVAATLHVKTPPQPVKTLTDLIPRVAANQTIYLKEYLATWSPKVSATANPWAHCRDYQQYGHPIKRDEKGNLRADCQPDTLYSWGPMLKITDLEGKIGVAAWKKRPFFGDALYMSETPTSSFGYGSSDESGGYGIRVKLKPGVRFSFLDATAPDCPNVAESEARNTVYYRVFNNDHGSNRDSSGADFVLCSSDPIESWSYGMRDFYDEFSKDVSRVLDPHYAGDWFSYMRRPAEPSGNYGPVIWNLGSDGHPFTQNPARKYP